jgi:hypothetical protein
MTDQQTDDHVEESVPHSETAATVSDFPTDYGNPSVVDFPDAAFDEPVDEDDEDPDPDEPEDDGEDEEPEPMEPGEENGDFEPEEPVMPPGIEEEQKEGQQ